jgi:hypothetical protein
MRPSQAGDFHARASIGLRRFLALRTQFIPLAERAREVLPVVLTLVLVLLLIAGLASTYVGRSRSPYDTCYGPNGRAVSGAALEERR